MTDARVSIAAPIAPAADLSARAGLPLTLRAGRIRHGADILAEEDLVRRLADMRDVLADGVGRRGRRVEYHMLNGVRHREHAHLADLPLRYELTALAGRPIGREAAKTLGHVHVCPPGGSMGYPEVVEVVHGEAGFLIQDLAEGPAGPRARQAWLVRARPGDWVVLPPDLAHVTIDLGAGPLVFSDVIDRRARGIYGGVAAARGFGWYVGADGTLRPNPRYAQPPHIEEVAAADWSGPSLAPLYRHFAADPGQLAWLSEPLAFTEVAPDLAARIADALG
jgi:glucose-6-phosphate isomerase, archaeal